MSVLSDLRREANVFAGTPVGDVMEAAAAHMEALESLVKGFLAHEEPNGTWTLEFEGPHAGAVLAFRVHGFENAVREAARD